MITDTERAVEKLVDAIGWAGPTEIEAAIKLCSEAKNDFSLNCHSRATYLRIERVLKESLK